MTTESEVNKEEEKQQVRSELIRWFYLVFPQISSDQLEKKKEKSVIEKVLTKSIEKAKVYNLN